MKLSLVLPICLSFAIISQAAPMNFDKRRFGVEHTPEADATFQEVKDLAQGSDKEAQAGNLSGAMVRALLAKAPACDQQDRADEVINLGKEFGGKKLEQYIDVAKRYRQLERNTPGEGQPSELCDKKPKNKELEGLTQAQDPTGKGKEADPVEDPKKVEDPEKEDPEKEDPEKEDPEKEDPEKEDPEKEDPEKEDPEKEDPEKEDPEKEDPEKEDPEKEDPEKEDPEKEDPEKEDPEKEDPEKEDPEKEDPEKEDPEKEDPKTEDPAGDNVAETDPVGGVKMPKIEKVDGDFIVNGNGFNGNLDAAHSRQCDVQKNLCFNKFNGGDKSFSGQDCEDQVTNCKEGPPVFA